MCFSALYCHSLRGFGCSRFVLVVSVPRKNLCRQPFEIPVEHARDENAVTMEFLGHVSVIRCRRQSLPISFAVARSLSLKQGTGNRGMGMRNGESLKRGIFKSGNL